MIQASAVSFRQNLGEMLNQVQYRHDSVVINTDGKPVAALVDARLFGDFDAFDHREQVAQFRMIGQVQLARRTEPELA